MQLCCWCFARVMQGWLSRRLCTLQWRFTAGLHAEQAFNECLLHPSPVSSLTMADQLWLQTYLFATPEARKWPFQLAELKTGQQFGTEILRGIFCTPSMLNVRGTAVPCQGRCLHQDARIMLLVMVESAMIALMLYFCCAGNFLVCLAVWQATAAQDIISNIFALFFPVAAFVSISFSHVVSSPAVRMSGSKAVAHCLQVLQ